jgi:4-amino-4-deoxy-L-arabinose transferase-like glycosyltransferase
MDSSAIEQPARQGGDAPEMCAARTNIGNLFLAGMGLYFGLHIVTRTLVSHNLQLDEAEQLILTQDWRWGYGSQPPLYDWIQHALFSVLGVHVFALSLLKNTLLWGIYLFTYLAAREIFSRDRLAVIAAASLLLLPHVVWESQRDQSHLILATLCSAAMLLVFVRLLKNPRPAYYAWFGALAGFGMMSKYDNIFLTLGLLVAALTIPRLRDVVMNRKIWLAAAVLLLVTAPHLHWLLVNQAEALSQSEKFHMEAATGLAVYFHAGLGFGIAVLKFLGVPFLIYLPLLLVGLKTKSANVSHPEKDDRIVLLQRALVFGLLLALLLVVLFRATQVRDRWLEPLLFAFPILLVAHVRLALEAGRGRYLLVLAGASAVFVLGAINLLVVGANRFHRAHNLNFPHAALAAGLRDVGFQKGVIITDGFFSGGNMRMQFQSSRVIVPELVARPPALGEDKLIILEDHEGLPQAREKFLDYVCRMSGLKPADVQLKPMEVPMDNGPRRTLRIEYAFIPGRSQ